MSREENIEALARLEELFAIQLPYELRQLYLTTDEGDILDGRMELLPLPRVERDAAFLAQGFGYVCFVDCHDSNPYALCCRQPLIGFVAHLFHDDESHLVCRSLGDFFDLASQTQRQLRHPEDQESDDSNLRLDSLSGDLAFEVPQRSADDARTGRELVRLAEGLDPTDPWRCEALRFAAQLFGPGHEADLAGVLALGNEYVRAAALRRCRCLDTPAARTIVQNDTREFNRFVAELAQAVEAAGIEVRRQTGFPHAWTIEPGNIHLNLSMLYVQREAPDFLEGLLQRIRRWQSERKR